MTKPIVTMTKRIVHGQNQIINITNLAQEEISKLGAPHVKLVINSSQIPSTVMTCRYDMYVAIYARDVKRVEESVLCRTSSMINIFSSSVEFNG